MIQLSPNFSAISLLDFHNFSQFLHRNAGLLPQNNLSFSTPKRLHTSHVQLKRHDTHSLKIQVAYKSTHQVNQFELNTRKHNFLISLFQTFQNSGASTSE